MLFEVQLKDPPAVVGRTVLLVQLATVSTACIHVQIRDVLENLFQHAACETLVYCSSNSQP
jgi:hypothetical protein